jgi:hypothetical protein
VALLASASVDVVKENDGELKVGVTAFKVCDVLEYVTEVPPTE